MVHHPYLVIPLGQGEDRERELPSPTRARCYMPEFAANNTLEELLEMAAVGKYIKPPPAIMERDKRELGQEDPVYDPLYQIRLEIRDKRKTEKNRHKVQEK